MKITHLASMDAVNTDAYDEDSSYERYCAPCMTAEHELKSLLLVPAGMIPLLEDDYGVCCNCGLDTNGENIPGRVGYRRWEAAYQIGVFETDRAWGGSEEGGWWYDCGQRVRSISRVFYGESVAYAACRRVNGWLDRMRPNWVRISSVNYYGGHFEARIYAQGQVPEAFPRDSPHYE